MRHRDRPTTAYELGVSPVELCLHADDFTQVLALQSSDGFVGGSQLVELICVAPCQLPQLSFETLPETSHKSYHTSLTF